MNIRKDLCRLFRESLINSRKAPVISPMYGSTIRIYFYEWSDVCRVPKTFYDIELFDEFLKRSGINLELYQREMIINFRTVYISCYNGSKKLCVRSTYKFLLDAMNNYNKEEEKVVGCEPIRFNIKDVIPKNDGTFFG